MRNGLWPAIFQMSFQTFMNFVMPIAIGTLKTRSVFGFNMLFGGIVLIWRIIWTLKTSPKHLIPTWWQNSLTSSNQKWTNDIWKNKNLFLIEDIGIWTLFFPVSFQTCFNSINSLAHATSITRTEVFWFDMRFGICKIIWWIFTGTTFVLSAFNRFHQAPYLICKSEEELTSVIFVNKKIWGHPETSGFPWSLNSF